MCRGFRQINLFISISVKTSVKILEAIKSNDQITIPELARIDPDRGGHWKIIDDKVWQ